MNRKTTYVSGDMTQTSSEKQIKVSQESNKENQIEGGLEKLTHVKIETKTAIASTKRIRKNPLMNFIGTFLPNKYLEGEYLFVEKKIINRIDQKISECKEKLGMK